MKIPRITYLVKDFLGDRCFAVCEEVSDTIQMWGTTANYEHETFESDAYHLSSWCDEHGFELKVFEQEEDFDTLWDSKND